MWVVWKASHGTRQSNAPTPSRRSNVAKIERRRERRERGSESLVRRSKSSSKSRDEFRARTKRGDAEKPRWLVESARSHSAPFPATHLDRNLLVLVVHEAQHDGHVVFFPHNLLALGAGLALFRFDLRHRESPPPGCAFAGFAARCRAGRSGSTRVCAGPIVPNAPRVVMRPKRSARRVGSREGSAKTRSPRTRGARNNGLRIRGKRRFAERGTFERFRVPRAHSDAARAQTHLRLRRARCRRPAAVCRTAASGGSPPPPCTSTSWRTWRRTTRTPRPR